ncbi:hypothetical protein LDENG_00284020, partial [Lucifuga dentata]
SPILKKPGVNHNDLNNYQSISNLPFVSKVLGSVLGPLLFIIYLLPLGHILCYKIHFHCCADNTPTVHLYKIKHLPSPPLPSPAVSRTSTSGCQITFSSLMVIKVRFSSLVQSLH